MKHLFLFLFCWTVIAPTGFAQSGIQGRLQSETNQALAFANVLLLYPADSSLFRGTTTGEDGQFIFPSVPSGEWLLHIRQLGFQPHYQELHHMQALNLGVIQLVGAPVELASVDITAEKQLFQKKIDRLVVNVENSVMSQGSNVLQVLERSPGIMRDGENDQLSLNGTEGVLIMINGKSIRLPQAEIMAMLRGMSADQVESIELIDTPPASFDAEGNGGVINIVLKKRLQPGRSATLGLSGGYGQGEKATISSALHHFQGKSNLRAAYSWQRDVTYSYWHAFSTQDMPPLGGELEVEFLNEIPNRTHAHNVNLGIDHDLSDKKRMGASMTYNLRHGLNGQAAHARYRSSSDSLLEMRSEVKSRFRQHNLLANTYFEQDLRQGEKITADLDYLLLFNRSPSTVNSRFFNDDEVLVKPEGEIFRNEQNGQSNTDIHIGVVKMDYSRSFREGLSLEAGMKYTYAINVTNAQLAALVDGEWVVEDRSSSDIEMTEQIAAAYTSLQASLTTKTQLIAGLRYEFVHRHIIDAQGDRTTQWGRFFPNLLLSHQLTDKTSLQFAFSRRITRPSYQDLTTNLIYISPLAVSTGNPLLQSVISNQLKVGLNHQGYAISLQAGRDLNPILRFQLLENEARDQMYLIPQNLAYQNFVNLQLNLPWRITSWWNANVNWTGSWRAYQLAHTRDQDKISYLTFNLNGNQTFTLPKGFSLELSGWYTGNHYNGTVKIKGFGVLNAGLRKQINNSSFQLSIEDIFQSFQVRTARGFEAREAFDIKGRLLFEAESALRPIVRLSFNHRFGQGKNRAARQGGASEEKSRLKNN
ncbi:MAG: TonB dependent receptor [Bacteroidota bacterium]